MNNKSRTENSILNILSGFVGQGIALIGSFVCRMVFVRCLSQEYLGVSSLFSSILSILSLAELGIGSAMGFELFQAIAKKNKDEIAAYIQLYGKAYRIIGSVITIIGLAIMPFLSFLIAEPPEIKESLYVLYVLYLFNSVFGYFYGGYKGSLITADQRGYQTNLLSNLILLVQDIAQAVFLILTHEFYTYLFCQIAATIASNIILVRLANKQYPFIKNKNVKKIEAKKIKRLFINVKAIMLSKISAYLVTGTDSVIISALNGLSATGVTANFGLLTSAINNILIQIVNGISSSVGNLNAIEGIEKQRKFFWIVQFICSWLFGWCTIIFLILSNDIVQICFGKTYVVSNGIVFALALNFYMVGMMNPVDMFQRTMGLFRYGQYLGLMTGIINIAVSILLGKCFGVMGILLGTAVSRILTNYTYIPYALFKHGIKSKPYKYFLNYLKNVVLIIAIYLIIYLISNSVHLKFLPLFGLKLALCIVLPNIVYLVLYHNTEQCKYLKVQVITVIKTAKKLIK